MDTQDAQDKRNSVYVLILRDISFLKHHLAKRAKNAKFFYKICLLPCLLILSLRDISLLLWRAR